MSKITFELADDELQAINSRPDLALAEMRLAAAMKLYELGRLSAGAAARLAGITQPEFLSKLDDYSILTFRQSLAELEEELNNA